MVPLQAVGLMVLKLLMMITFFMALRLQRTPAEAAPSPQGGPCRASCGGIPINYPFGVEDGCGAPQFRHMFNCSTESDLFFVTPSGSYKVESIDYQKKTVEIYDPAMSTCSILQPHHEFIMTEVQSAIIPPTPDTVFALLNCSIDSPVLNHYKYLCFDFSDHSCDELYGACNAFRVFHDLPISSSSSTTNFTGPAPSGPPAPPPCCFTGYDTLRYMSMNILDCTHYTCVLNTNKLKGIPPLDWVYGIKLSYSIPELGAIAALNLVARAAMILRQLKGYSRVSAPLPLMLLDNAPQAASRHQVVMGAAILLCGHSTLPFFCLSFQELINDSSPFCYKSYLLL